MTGQVLAVDGGLSNIKSLWEPLAAKN
jgi:hypothetical protein